MGTIPDIPRKYLTLFCLLLGFAFFTLGGIAFAKNVFYGFLFTIVAVILFFAGVRIGRQEPETG
jgi:hypothetical protein